MSPYYLLQTRQKKLGHWKIFRQNNKIQVYRDETKAKQDSEKYEKEFNFPFKVKQKKHHPRIEHPKCLWQDII